MGSYAGTCEIIEVKDERLDRKQKPPLVRRGHNKFLEDNINHLFESINLRSSKSLDLSDHVRRDASKRPMRGGSGGGSHSPVIGFSEPVSLKQALRGLCISQAAEMAAIKRSSKLPPGSPSVLEAGRITSSNRFADTSEASTSGAIGKVTRHHQELYVKSENHSPHSSPRPVVKPMRQNHRIAPAESTLSAPRYASKSTVNRTELSCEQKEKTLQAEKFPSSSKNVPQHALSSPPTVDKPVIICDMPAESVSSTSQEMTQHVKEPKMKVLNRNSPDDSNKSAVTSFKIANKAAPKLRRKSRLQSVPSSGVVTRSNKETKSNKSTYSVKPSVKNKTFVKKKVRPTESPQQLICQKCQCSLKNVGPESTKEHAEASENSTTNCHASKPGFTGNCHDESGTRILKLNKTSQGEFSQSSKSSIEDYSFSTTISDESNLSGCSTGGRPHMSKDSRWEAINRVRKQHGFLGLNHFDLLKKLGCGDIGTVYLAELSGTNCLFAIKVMDNGFLMRRKKMPRAQTEREILRILDHPFLPTLYAQFTSDNLSCLVMEFCPGGDLHVLRQKQPPRYFPEAAARFYVAEVLLALEYLHMQGVVYRDLKPENILVREDGHIMLTDFDLSLRCSVNPTLLKSSSLGVEAPRISGPCTGSNCIDPFCSGPSCQVSCFSPRILPPTSARARKLKVEAAALKRSLPQLVVEPTEARSNSFVGTHEYLAPEIIKGEGHGSAVDWWTLGVFLYELLYGKTPFKGGGNEETLVNVVMQNLRFPDIPIVSIHARDLIRGLLVKEPENRMGTETGAAEIKRHPFFDGLNWALIRCAIPPQVPDLCDTAVANIAFPEKSKMFLEYSTKEHLEFELF